MIGKVDDCCRALVDIETRPAPNGPGVSVTAWIDTAFDGHLVFPRSLIDELELESLVETEAVLADGRKVVLDTFLCYLDWFGDVIPLQVIANDGRFPLLGTGLLEERILHVNFVNKRLTLD